MGDERRIENQGIEDLTLKELFSLPQGSLSDPNLVAGMESDDFRALRKELSERPVPIAWGHVQSEMAGLLSAMLNATVLSVWCRAWEKYRGLMDDVEHSRKSPDAFVLSQLAEHSIDSTLHPYIEVFLGSKQLQKISFDVILTTRLRGLVLGLKKGLIMSIGLAECEWTGSIQIKGVTLVRRDLQKLTVPGRVEFKRGISVGGNA
jgi:hypothetical protein